MCFACAFRVQGSGSRQAEAFARGGERSRGGGVGGGWWGVLPRVEMVQSPWCSGGGAWVVGLVRGMEGGVAVGNRGDFG